MKSLIASGSFIGKSEERERVRERGDSDSEAVGRSRQEPTGFNSHCAGGANRRPSGEVQMGRERSGRFEDLQEISQKKPNTVSRI